MSLLAPWGLAFLATLPVITALYFLKLRRTRRVISSTLLWQRSVVEMRANTPFQRLRSHLLLLLQLLLALLAALALARPYLPGMGRLADRRVIVIDASASMGAKDGSGATRFDLARRRARELAGGGQAGTEAMLLVAGSRPHVAQPFTSDRRAVDAALGALVPEEAPSDMARALSLALALTARDASRDIVVLSDGVAEPLSESLATAPGVRLELVGEPADNVGIVTFDAVRVTGSANDWDVFVGVMNASDAPRTERVVLEKDGEVVDARAIPILPRASAGTVLRVSARGGSALEARIEGSDALQLDDRAFGVLAERTRLRVAVASRGGAVEPWLGRVLATVPDLEVVPVSATAIDPAGFDLVILDGVTPSELAPGAYLLIDPSGDVSGAGRVLLRAGASLERPAILDWDRRSALLRYVTFADVHLARGRVLVPGPGVSALAETRDGALMVGMPAGPIRFVAWGFDHRASDLPYRAAFPILLGNALAELPARAQAEMPLSHHTGEMVPIVLAAEAWARARATPTPVVVDPVGGRREVAQLAGQLVADRTGRAGSYRVEQAGTQLSAFAVSLLSAQETDLRPRLVVTSGAGGPTRAMHPAVRAELAPWLMLAALVLLLLEWAVYHRRSYA